LQLLQVIYFQNTGFRHWFWKYRLLTGVCQTCSKMPARPVKYRPSGNPTHKRSNCTSPLQERHFPTPSCHTEKQSLYWKWAAYLCRVLHFNRQNL